MMAEPRTYTIPLRREWLKAPKYKRAKKAIAAVREFTIHHMRNENVLIGPKLNLKIWEHGIKNPPGRVKVTCYEDKEGVVRVELFGFEFKPQEKKEGKKPKASGLMGKMQEKLETKEDAPKKEATTKKDIKEVKKGVEVKPEEKKEEVKEEKPAEKAEDKPAAEAPSEEKKEEPAAEPAPEKKA